MVFNMGFNLNPSRSSTIITLCCIANFINSADRVIMPTAIIQMKDEFNLNLHNQGWVLSSYAIGYMASGVVGASASKRYGGKLTLLVAVFLWSISTFITPIIAHSYYTLISLRIILGLGEGLGLPTIFHIFSHSIPIDERSRAFGYLVAAGSIGQTLASAVCPHLHWHTMFYSFGALGFIWCMLWLALYKEMCATMTEEEFVEEPKIMDTAVQWKQFFTCWPLWSLYIAHFTMNWSNYIIMHWLPTYLHLNLAANDTDIMYTALPYVFNSLFGVASGHLADRLITHYKWSVLSVRKLMTALGLIGPGLFMIWFSTMTSLGYALILVTISMGLSACNAAGHLSNHAEVAPSHAGTTFAISNTIATLPGILCGPLTAELVTQSGNRWFPVFIIASMMNFVGGLIYLTHSSSSQVL